MDIKASASLKKTQLFYVCFSRLKLSKLDSFRLFKFNRYYQQEPVGNNHLKLSHIGDTVDDGFFEGHDSNSLSVIQGAIKD